MNTIKTDPTVKPDSLRDDLRHRPEAIARGWTPELGVFDKENGLDPVSGVPAWPIQFRRNLSSEVSRHIWRIRDGWRCAELDASGHYVNHRTHSDLLTALRKES